MDLNKLKGHILDSVIAQIPEVMQKFGINDSVKLAHFLAQCGHESGGFKVVNENLNYELVKQIFYASSSSVYGDQKKFPINEEAILKALELTPPELSADIYRTGIYLTGGGALLRGLDKRISMKTKLPVKIAEDPLRAVVRGTGIALKNIERFKFLMP